jgi:hypothetical protein
MRQLFRVVITSALVATLAVAGLAGSAFAAAFHSQGNGTNFEMFEDLCLDDGSIILCFEVHGRITIVQQDNGDEIATTAVRTRSFVVEGGRITSAQIDHSVFQTKLVDGAFSRELQISTTRELVPGQQCVLHLQLTFEDGVVTVDRSSVNCN